MLLFWPLIIPFFTAVLCLLSWRSTEMQRGISLLGAIALLVVSVMIISRVSAEGAFAEQAGGWPAPFGISMVADWFSAVLVLLTGIVAVSVVVFSFTDVTHEEEHFGFHPLVHALLAGICGSFLTGDIFNMYVWFEVMLISSFGLLVIGGGRNQLDGAVKYVGLNLIATVAFIAGVGLLYGATGALNMADLHLRLADREADAAIRASAAFLLFAFASKAALFPVFFWLPASYHTPAFATSALFAALLTKVGVYALIRVFTLVYPSGDAILMSILIWGGVLTMLAGVLGALCQNSIRRVLGYSIISSIGFMILGLGIGTPMALAGAAFYLFQDILVKASLFLSAGMATKLTGSELFSRSGGLWRARPWFSMLFLIPALALAGVPPFSGFWPKLLLVQATLGIGSWGLTLAVLGTGLLTLFAMGRIWAAMFWSAHPEGDYAITRRVDGWTLAGPVALTFIIVLIGAQPAWFIEVSQAVAGQLIDPAAYVAAVLGGGE